MTEEEFLTKGNNSTEYIDWSDEVIPRPEWDIKCKKVILNNLPSEIKTLYLTYETRYRKIVPFYVEIMSEDKACSVYESDVFMTEGFSNQNIYYVYEDYTLDDNKPIYYGIETNPDYVYKTRVDKRIIMLEKEKGIGSRKLITNINEYQAKVYQACMIKKCAVENKYLLNFEYMSVRGYYDKAVQKSEVAKESFVYKDSFFECFFPNIYKEEQPFDVVELNDLSVVNFYSNQNAEVVNWLLQANARINKTNTNATKAVIVDNYIPYFDYVKIKESGKKIFAVEDVLKFISDKNPNGLLGKKRKISVPKYDKVKRDKIRNFLNIYADKVDSFCNYMKLYPYQAKYWLNPLLSSELKGCVVDEEIQSDLIVIIREIYFTKYSDKTSGYEETIKNYTKLGLFEELVEVLKNQNGLAYELRKAMAYSELDKEVSL